MKAAVDKLVDFAKELPGFGLVFLIAALARNYVKPDGSEPSVRETFLTALACWVLYRVGALLDKIYDRIYGPKSTRECAWKLDVLRQARNLAAKALFEPINPRVTDYASATRYGCVGDKPFPSLYSLCSILAKPTEVWRKRIAPKIDVSKAARTVFVFLVVAMIAQFPGLRDVIGATPYFTRLGLLAEWWVQGIMAVVVFLVYFGLRVEHNLELFEYVARSVAHVPVEDKRAAVIFEVVVPRTRVS